MSWTILRKVVICLQLIVESSYLTVIKGEANITIPPKSVNISLNGEANFNCTGIGSTFFWKANGTQLSTGGKHFISPVPLLIDEVQGLRMSMLRIIVTSYDNATNITCTAIQLKPTFSISNESEPALLLVQGLLMPVSNLNATKTNSTTVLISWNAPFTLEGVPILGYNITITNTTSGENETVSIEGDTTILYYSIGHTDHDSNFMVTVVSVNAIGAGKSTTTTFSNTVFSYIISSDLFSFMKSSSISVPQVYATVSSNRPVFTITPDSPDNITISVMALALVTGTVFALVLLLLCTSTATVACFCYYKRRPIFINKEFLTTQDAITVPVVSSNPAYAINYSKEADLTKEYSSDYENIEEVYFKQNGENSDDTVDAHGDYEPIESHS